MMVTISECQSEKEHKLSKPSSPACLPSCLFSSTVHSSAASDDDGDAAAARARPASPRSPYAWLKSTAVHELPEIRWRCRSLIARLGRNPRRRHNNSTDFSYDASSYALNFEDAYGRDDEEFPLRGFAARLPATPPPAKGREIVGFS